MPDLKITDNPVRSVALGKLISPEKLLPGVCLGKKQPLDKINSSQSSLAAAV